MGPSGLTVVIVRDDLIGNAREGTPVMLDYKIQADNGSMYNTPPCYSIYVAGLVFKWLLDMGGLKEIERRNVAKAKVLYDYLDASEMFKPTADKEFRSIMNVCFVTGDAELDKEFVSAAKKAGFENLKGHRSVGGMRASIYNAMPAEGVKALTEFMAEFERSKK
jgi:phosphoserine aminotransferase